MESTRLNIESDPNGIQHRDNKIHNNFWAFKLWQILFLFEIEFQRIAVSSLA